MTNNNKIPNNSVVNNDENAKQRALSDNSTHSSFDDKSSAASNLRGDIEYDDRVIEKIIGRAVSSVNGLLSVEGGFFAGIKNKLVNSDNPSEGVNVEVGKKQVAADLNIIVEYDIDIPKVVDEMREKIIDSISKDTHLDVIEVNVNISDIKTKEEFEQEQTTLQDRMSDAGEAISTGTDRAKDSIQNSAKNMRDQVKESRENSRVE